MHLLVTAGNTRAPIDRVRCITNIFTGRTGAQIAVRAWERGHTVTLLTSHPEAVVQVCDGPEPTGPRWQHRPYLTFDDLHRLMAELARQPNPNSLIHSAAVSDYR